MKPARAASALWAMLFLLPLSGCAALNAGVMNHAGPVAATQWKLYLIVGAVLVFVAAPVLILTPLFAWHYRISNKRHAFKPKWDFSWWLEALIWLPPAGIVVGLAFVLWTYTHQLDPYRPLASAKPPLELQAVGFDWKWLFIYPDQHIAVLNQMVIPVGRPVHIRLTSGTVMQSLMIPQLAGQIYAMAGMTSELNLAASRPGTFRGENTQFNGDGFQNEKFDVVAVPPAAYAQWASQVSASNHPLDAADFEGLFKKSSVPNAVSFSSIPQDLYKQIMTKSQEPRK